MRRHLLALLIAPFAVHATTTTFTSCTAGTTTDTPCPGNLYQTTGLSGPTYFVSAFAEASDTPLGSISALAEGSAGYSPCDVPGCPPAPASLSAFAEAIVNDIDYTTGPIRSGFIQISEMMGYTNFPGWDVIDGPYTYGGGPFEGQGCLPGRSGSEDCFGSATFPFELGIPFQVDAGATGGAAATASQGGGRGGYAEVTLAFSLFESDGSTPVPFFAAPEPGTSGLLLCGCVVLLARVRRLSRPKTAL